MLSAVLPRMIRYRSLTCLLTGLLMIAGVLPVSAHRSGTTARDTAAVEVEKKDPGDAVLYSLGGTVVLAPAFGTGLIIGPAFGHFYADNSAQAWKGIGTRACGALLPLVATGVSIGTTSEKSWAPFGVFLVSSGIAAVGITASAVYDIATADNAAREYNQAHGLQARVIPTVGGARGKQVGLALRVTF